MADDALAPYITRPSTNMVLTTKFQQVMVFIGKGFQLPVPSQIKSNGKCKYIFYISTRFFSTLRETAVVVCPLTHTRYPTNMHMISQCFVLFWLNNSWQTHVIYVAISFRVTSSTLGQSYDCPSVGEATLNRCRIRRLLWCP